MVRKVIQGIAIALFSLMLVFSPAVFPFLPANVAHAQEDDDEGVIAQLKNIPVAAAQTMANMLLLTIAQVLLHVISFLGYLFSLAIEILRWTLQYRGYATQAEVGVGWALVRDVINSFFIVVLIAIAIATIIRFQPYNFRSTLPRLIVAALLVNFSRTICLLAISFADSVMGTFGTQLVQILPVYALGLRLPALTALGEDSVGGVFGAFSTAAVQKQPQEMLLIVVSILIAIVMMVFALGGLVMFCIILLFRILILWFLMILSPLAFFLWGTPGRAASYWGQWLEEFVKHVIIGPVGAFFLYLIAYFYVQNLQSSYGFQTTTPLPQAVNTLGTNPQVFVGYLISLGMMFIALEIIEQFGVRGGQFARKVGIEGVSKGLLKSMANTYSLGADLATKWSGGRIPTGVLKPWQALEGIQQGLAGKRERIAEDARRAQANRLAKLEAGGGLGALAFGTLTGDANFIKNQGFKEFYYRARASLALGRVERGSEDELKAMGQGYRDDSKTKSVFAGMTAEQKERYGNMTRSELLATAENFNKYGKLAGYRNKINALTQDRAAAIADGNNVRAAELTNQINELSVQATAERNSIQDYDDVAYQRAAAAQSVDENGEALKAMEGAMKNSKGDIGVDGTISTGVASKDKAWENRGERAIKELKRRQKGVQVARAASRADVVDKVKDYMSENYEKDVKYDLEDLYSNLRSNDSPDSREKFAGDLLQAAKQGNADDVLLRLDPKFTATVKGRAALVDHMEKELGFERQDALAIIAEVQGRNAGANKLADTGWVRLDGLTKDFELVTEQQHKEIIKGRTEGQSLEDMLRKFGRDGLGAKDPMTGKYVADAGISERLKKEDFTPIITNDTTLGRIPRNTKQFLVDNADSFGISPAQVQILKDNLKI